MAECGMKNRMFEKIVTGWSLPVVGLSLVGCSGPMDNMVVDKFTLRDAKIEGYDVPMVRGDQQKRLYGAVTVADHEARLGQYYEVTWNLIGLVENPIEPVTVIYRYRQASTGSKLKFLSKRYEPGVAEGKVEFNIIGENYTKGGRVLSWKADLVYGGRVLESKQSYLWRR